MAEQPAHVLTEAQAPSIKAVGGVIYRRNRRGQVELLLIKKRFGYWTLPKGQVKNGESDTDAVTREVREETGIRAVVEAPVRPVSYTILKDGQPRQKIVTYYILQAQKGRPRPNTKEQIQRVRWFPARSAIGRIRRGRVRRVAERATSMLTSPAKTGTTA
jgi:8-oxo-dGTP pyrophosphatase MutT (NUDIX family)